MIALLFLAASTLDPYLQRFTLEARVSALLFVPEDRLHDDLLGNIDVKFSGIESVLFRINEGGDEYEPRVLSEFDCADHLIRQVTYGIAGEVTTEATRRYEHGRIVALRLVSNEIYPSSVTEAGFVYDDAGRLESTHCTVDEVETFNGVCTYLPDGQVMLLTTEFQSGRKPKQSTYRIESNASGYVTREWKKAEGSSESLVERAEYDDKGRITSLVFVNQYTNDLFTHTFTYSEGSSSWRRRNIDDSDGRLISSEVSFFAASGALIHSESWDYSGARIAQDVSTPEVTKYQFDDYHEDGWFLDYGVQTAATKSIESQKHVLERDENGAVVGWKCFYVSGAPPVVRPGTHVHLELKPRTTSR